MEGQGVDSLDTGCGATDSQVEQGLEGGCAVEIKRGSQLATGARRA